MLGVQRTDVAIIGAGITGISAALHLAETGCAVAVLDQGGIGWGASGRNGGQVNPGLKPDPDAVRDRAGERMVAAGWAAPALVFDLIARHAIACEATQGGTLRAATAPADVAGIERLAAQCARRGDPVSVLDADAVAGATGTNAYRAALFDPRGGQLNPLSYTRGLASAAARAGATLHGECAVTRLERRATGWRLHGPGYALDAARVILATNGYTDALWPKLAKSVVPVFSAIIASAPLLSDIRTRLLPGRQVLYELGAITTYYRVDAHGRLLIGGRSKSRDLAGPSAFPFLARHTTRLWPDLADMTWTHGWNGQLAMTTDHYPHWHEPAPNLFACLGYNGRGNAMATLLGRELAQRINGAPTANLLLPPTPIRAIPLHRFWKLAVSTRVAWGRLTDRRS